MLIDSHCHLPLLGDDAHVATVIDEARELGVERMLCVSIDLESYPDVLRVANNYDCVHASVGVHPNAELPAEVTLDTLLQYARDPQVIAIGETGLDYFRSSGDLDWQRQRFRVHIRAAKAAGKPLIIHTREAAADVISILREERAEETGGVMHCFVEDWDTAQQAMDLNFYISFSGIVTFKNAPQVREVAKRVPLDRILVETDAPYLAPVPHRGKTNHPGYTRYVAEFIADLRDLSLQQIAEHTSANFRRLFGTA